MSTLIGMATYGNCGFTKLAVQSFRETVKNPYDMVFVVGKPDDMETIEYLKSEGFPFVYHTYNKGFPSAINDMYDFAWKMNNYDYLIIAGNDIYAYPYAVDSLIEVANTTKNVWVGALEVNVKNIYQEFPESRSCFYGENYNYNFTGRPWECFKNFSDQVGIVEKSTSDIHNLCLFKKEVMEKLGYIDVNFYPAYFEDNDYVHRQGLEGTVESCNVSNARYFHFWSRTIHQGSGGSNNTFFDRNKEYYIKKWGGEPGHERFSIPFDGAHHLIDIPMGINIQDRSLEEFYINYWRNRM